MRHFEARACRANIHAPSGGAGKLEFVLDIVHEAADDYSLNRFWFANLREFGMKKSLGLLVAALAVSFNAQSVTIDFETVAGLTPLNSATDGTSLPAGSSIVGEIPGLVISSLGPAKDVVVDGSTKNFSGVSWLDFTGTGSTAHSGSRVIAGANDDPADSSLDVVDFNNFVEFRLLNTGNKFFKIWLEVLSGTTVTAIFRDDINGGNDLSNQSITSSGFVEFLSAGADIRNVVFIPVGGNGIWLDDLTYAANNGNGNGGGTTPEPGSLLLLALGLVGFWLTRREISRP